MSVLDQLSSFICELEFDRVPEEVVNEAKRCILDTVGVIVAGMKARPCSAVTEHSKQTYRVGHSQILGTGVRLQPMGAAFANAVAGHAYDFDDTSYTGIMHGSVVVLPAALAMAEHRTVGGKRLLEAFIAGVEAEYAFAEWCTTHLYFKGWWTSAVYGPLGAAAATAKLLDLDYRTTAHALAIAMGNTSGMKASFGSDAKPLGVGVAAATGIESGLLAAAGLGGPANVLESSNGFLSLYNDNISLPHKALELSTKWRLSDPGILFKSYPVCSAAQAAAELVAKLVTQNELQTSEIVSVLCEVPPLVAISLVYNEPKSVREAQFSMPFAIACILVYGDVRLQHLSEKVLADTELKLQMKKVVMRVPEYLENDEDVHQRCPEGAGITITTASKHQFSEFLERPTGMPGNPMSDEALESKFRNCMSHGQVSDEQASQVAKRLWRLETVKDLTGIMD